MAKKLTQEAEHELQALGRRMLLTLDFAQRAQDFPSASQLRALVEGAIARRDLRTVRLMNREINDLMIGLAPHERDGLEALLRERLGVDVDEERAAMSQKVGQILERGSIASEKERRRLEDYGEMLEATGGAPSEIAAVRRLLQRG